MTLERATEISVQAFAAGKSRTHPYVATLIDGLWVMRDGPGKKRDPRKIEVMACGLTPEEALERTRALNLGWHYLCHVYPNADDSSNVRDAYKREHYRALGTEWLFTHDLIDIPAFDCEPPVRQIHSADVWRTIPQRAPQPRHFRPDARGYCIWDEARDYGWVHSVPYGDDSWVSDLYVYAEFRRSGYGRALMSRLLRDDVQHGVQTSVLIASSAGAQLYPHLGYRQVGMLQIFCPLARS